MDPVSLSDTNAKIRSHVQDKCSGGRTTNSPRLTEEVRRRIKLNPYIKIFVLSFTLHSDQLQLDRALTERWEQVGRAKDKRLEEKKTDIKGRIESIKN